MARELLGAWGPALNHLETMIPGQGGNPFAGWSVATSPAPTHGTYIFKCVSGSTNLLILGNTASFTAKTYVWFVLRGFRLTGTLASGDEVKFLNLSGAQLQEFFWIYETSSTYKIRMKTTGTTVFTSTNAFNVDQWYGIRAQWDGTNLTLWVDGTQEGQAAETEKPTTFGINLRKTTLSTGQEQYYRGGELCQSNSESDRPGTAVEVDRLDPDGDTAEDDATGVTDTVDKYKNWDDYVGGNAPDDDTSYNLLDSVAEQKQVSTATTHTPTDVIEGIIYRLWARAAAGGKSGLTHARIKEGSNASEVALTSMSSTTFVAQAAVFDLAPDGGAWTQSDVDALEIGLLLDDAADVNIRPSALAVELISVDDDAPEVEEEGGTGASGVGVAVAIAPSAAGAPSAPAAAPGREAAPSAPPAAPAPAAAPTPIAVGPHTRSVQVIGDPILMARPEGGPLRALEAAEDALEKRLRE